MRKPRRRRGNGKFGWTLEACAALTGEWIMKKKMDVYGIITERILDQLEKGVVPWRKPWTTAGVVPTNLVSKKEYRGINVWVLMSQNYGSPYWVTYNQAKKLKGHVKAGEKGTPVVFWKWIEKEEKDKETGEKKTKRFPFLRYYTVFNVEQTEGIDESKIPQVEKKEIDPIECCESVVEGMPNRPHIIHGGGSASYSPMLDTVQMPQRNQFHSAEGYYCTLFHELSHSTGHESRLNRKTINVTASYGSEDYSKEELVAEMSAAFLSGHCGIENEVIDNNAAYIAGWMKAIADDKKLVVMAAAQAQKSADYILDKKQNEEK